MIAAALSALAMFLLIVSLAGAYDSNRDRSDTVLITCLGVGALICAFAAGALQ